MIDVVFYLVTLVATLHAEDILVLQPFCFRSHGLIIKPVTLELGRRGHNVTFVSSYSLEESDPLPGNVSEIIIHEFSPYIKRVKKIVHDVSKEHGFSASIFKDFYSVHSEMCLVLYNKGFLQEWISANRTFDLVIMDVALNFCILPLWQILGKSLILFNSARMLPTESRAFNVPVPPSYIPTTNLPYKPSQMNFWQRMFNGIAWVSMNFFDRFSHQYIFDHVVLPHFPQARSFQESMNEVSLALINGDPIMNLPRPVLPTVINIGGIHCRPAQLLPQGSLKDFVDDSGDDGFILVSFGSIFDGNMASKELQSIFLTAFAHVKQRVVWKYESEMVNISSNIKLVSWLPQQDLLGHPKCRAFLNHGGLLSLQESIYHGVPIVGVPIAPTDSPSNVALASDLGIGISLDPNSLTVDKLTTALKQACNDREMKSKVCKAGKIFRDRNQSPLDTAIYWVEYVIRHKGAVHLRGHGTELNFIQYFLLDVTVILFVVLIFVLIVVWFICKYLFRFYHTLTRHFQEVSLKIKLN